MPAISPKSTGEVIPIKFNFGQVVSTISSAVVTVSVKSGTDASPSSMLSGSAAISGTTVTQLIQGGITGNIYSILCSITSGSAVYELNASMAIAATT